MARDATVTILEEQTINEKYAAPMRFATDGAGARELALFASAANFDTVTTVTVEVMTSVRNRPQDYQPLAEFVLTPASPTAYTYATQFARYLWPKVQCSTASGSVDIEVLANFKS